MHTLNIYVYFVLDILRLSQMPAHTHTRIKYNSYSRRRDKLGEIVASRGKFKAHKNAFKNFERRIEQQQRCT